MAKRSWGNRILVTVLITVLGVVGVMFVPAYTRYRSLGAELRRVKVDLELREKRLNELSGKLFRIKNDPAEVERIAREIYGFCRPDEIIVHYNTPTSPEKNRK